MKRYIKITLNIFIPLLAGAVIYYVTSPEVVFVQELDGMLGIIRESYDSPDGDLNNLNIVYKLFAFLRNYLLDMLWAYSLTFCIYALLDNGAESVYKTALISITFAVTMELLQLTTAVKGTFDVIDILVELIAVFIIKLR